MIPQATITPELVDAMLRTDPYTFTQAAFPIVAAQGRFLRNWHVEAMTYALERVLRGEISRLIITIPPRSLKSICASVVFPAFALGHNPTRKFICVSYSQGLAEKHANDCRALMHSSLYRRGVFPPSPPAPGTHPRIPPPTGGPRLGSLLAGALTPPPPQLHHLARPPPPPTTTSLPAHEQ